MHVPPFRLRRLPEPPPLFYAFNAPQLFALSPADYADVMLIPRFLADVERRSLPMTFPDARIRLTRSSDS